MSNVVSTVDFLVKKIELNKAELSKKMTAEKRQEVFEHQDKLVDLLMAESEKARASNDLDRMKYMRDRIKAIL
jgi:hypothetical protein